MLQERYLDSVKVTSVDYDLLMATLKRIAGDMRNQNVEVRRILLYGSFVRGDFTPESDLDLIIIVGKADTPFLFRAERFMEFFRGVPLEVNIHVYTEGEITKIKEKGNRFIVEVMEEAREL